MDSPIPASDSNQPVFGDNNAADSSAASSINSAGTASSAEAENVDQRPIGNSLRSDIENR